MPLRSLGQEDPLEEGTATNLHQYSCLEKPMDRGAWRAKVHRVRKSQTRLKRLSTQYTRITAHREGGGWLGGQRPGI